LSCHVVAANLQKAPANHPQSRFATNSTMDFLQPNLKHFCLRKNIKTRISVHDHHIILRYKLGEEFSPLTPDHSGNCGKIHFAFNCLMLFFFVHSFSSVR
jgi:hypothetical protein